MSVPGQRGPRAAVLPFGAACLAAAWLAGDSRCAAQGGEVAKAQPSLTLQSRSCPDDWAGRLERFVQIELGTEPTGPSADALRIELRCDGDVVDIAVAQHGDAVGTRRLMDLDATAPSVRARVVALAIAGLARELALMAQPPPAGEPRREPVAAPAPAPASAPQSESESVPVPAPESEPESESESESEPGTAPASTSAPARALQVDLLFSASHFTAGEAVIWGGGARIHMLAFAPYRLAFDVQAGTYSRQTTLGDTRLVTGSLSARFGVTLAGPELALTPGVGQRLGLARASAHAGDPDAASAVALTAPWTASFVFVAFEAAAFGRYVLGLDAELGAVLLPVHGRVERGDDVDVDGVWLALSAVFGIRL